MNRWIKTNPVVDTFLDKHQEIWPLVLASLERRNNKDTIAPLEDPVWNERYFGLENVSIFKEASERRKQEVLWKSTLSILSEASYIEQLGLAFNAKMILLANNLEERMLYSLFAADEAQHLFWVSSHMPKTGSQDKQKPFFQLLSSIIEDGSKAPLTCLIQVLLEGWGINHYLSIAQDCQNGGLKTYLQKILKDESLHHGSGLMLWNQLSLNSREEHFTIEMLARLFEMVQTGPQMIVTNIEQSFGHLSFSQKTTIFEELKCEEQSNNRITLLKSLLGQNHANKLLSRLDERGIFRAYSATECARYHV